MTDDTPEETTGLAADRAETPPGVPTVDGRTVLLVVAVLSVLHADELVGGHASATLLFGWLPVHLGYHLALSLLHVGVLVVVYYNWPLEWSGHGTRPDDDS